MVKKISHMAIRFPRATVLIVLLATLVFVAQLGKLRWETDARVYLPKGHEAIVYDEKVADVFGFKDSIIIGVVNDQGVFNPDTLERIARITEKVAALPGVVATRSIDVASLSTALMFVGDETSIGTVRLMPIVPQDAAAIERLKKSVYANADLFVGNIVSADGKAAMIRAKLKEGIEHRYQTYFQIKCQILAPEGAGWEGCDAGWSGSGAHSGDQGSWGQQNSSGKGQWQGPSQWQGGSQGGQGESTRAGGDKLYLAGRPVIEVTSGLHAMADMKIMIPALVMMLSVALFWIFRGLRGVVLPLFVMAASLIWTMGIMGLAGYPLYTISTMMPVILVAVGIGDAIHLLSHYYNRVLDDPYRPAGEIVREVVDRLGLPLITTSITTVVGFFSLIFADMPPFKVFGVFTMLGIMLSWLLTVTFIPAALTLMKPKVGNYLSKRRSMRVHAEQDRLTRILVGLGQVLIARRKVAWAVLGVLVAVSAVGASRLHVNSSWMSDFRQDSELVRSNQMLNQKFAGTIFLNVVVEGKQKDALKSPEVLSKIEALQRHVERMPYVGRSLSVVDYLKSMNKTLHAGDAAYDVLPASKEAISEYLYLFSISGRPEQLDEVIDFDYQRTLVTFWVKTDHTAPLSEIIEETRRYADREFKGLDVDVNFAGSANNSFIWAKLLIDSQIWSILLSKVGIFLLAAVLFRSFVKGFYTIVPVTLSTLFIAGAAGFMGIPLDVSTALAAGVAIGVGVDYAVHYIFRYQDEIRDSGNADLAAANTLRSVGRTIVLNALVVTAGFMILFFSQFPPHVKLGYFVAAYMVVSCIAALSALPLLFSLRRPVPRALEKAHAP